MLLIILEINIFRHLFWFCIKILFFELDFKVFITWTEIFIQKGLYQSILLQTINQNDFFSKIQTLFFSKIPFLFFSIFLTFYYSFCRFNFRSLFIVQLTKKKSQTLHPNLRSYELSYPLGETPSENKNFQTRTNELETAISSIRGMPRIVSPAACFRFCGQARKTVPSSGARVFAPLAIKCTYKVFVSKCLIRRRPFFVSASFFFLAFFLFAAPLIADSLCQKGVVI